MADRNILIVEDELVTVELIREVIESRGYAITDAVTNGSDALQSIDRERPDLILMDIRIKGDMDGIELTRVIGEKYQIPVIYLTAFADHKTVERAKTTESYGYLIKPFGEMELVTNIEIALHKHRLDRKLRESEKRYRTLFETMKDAMYMHDMTGAIIDFNSALEKMFGYSREEVFGIRVQDVFANREDPVHFLERIRKDGFIKDFPASMRRKDGEIIQCLLTANLERSPDDGKKIIRGVIRDITEIERAHTALREQQDFMDAVLDSLPTVFYAVNREGRFVKWNRMMEELYGTTVDRMTGVSVFDVMNDANRELFRRKLGEGFAGGSVMFEARFRQGDRNNEMRDFIVTGRRVTIGGDDYLVGSALDITERKEMEEALRGSEEKYRTLVENLNDVIYTLDTAGVITYMSPALERISHYSPDEIIGKNFRELIHPDDLPGLVRQFARTVSGVNESYEFRVLDKNGTVRHVRTSSRVITIGGAVTGITGVMADITERKKYIDDLRNAHEDIANILNSIMSILIGVDTHDVITHWNIMAEQTFGIPAEKALGMKITGFDIEWEWDNIYGGISSCIIGDCPINLSDINYRGKNGKRGILGITINPIKDENDLLKGFLIYGKDVTERRIIEQQLLQSSKMATVGEMATGVAHELNQPLNVIKMASQYLMDGINEKYATDEFVRERIGKIVAQVDRAAHIINHLREFGRKSDYDFNMIDPNMPVRVAFDMLGEQLRVNDIGVSLDLAKDLPLIWGDLSKLEQVFINLVVNAKDAILGVKNPLQEKNIVVKSYGSPDGGGVLIRFSDTGPGIPPDVIERIFEPFFHDQGSG